MGPGGGLTYPRGVPWACSERVETPPVHGLLAQPVRSCGPLAKPLDFPANRELGEQTHLRDGLMLGFWVIAPGSRGNASQQPHSNPPDRRPAGREDTKVPCAGLVWQPGRDVSVLVSSPHTVSSCLPAENGLPTLLLHPVAILRVVQKDVGPGLCLQMTPR